MLSHKLPNNLRLSFSTFILFKRKTNDKSISKPNKRQREDPNSQALVVNNGTLSSSPQETLQISNNDFRYKEKKVSN